MVAIRGAITVEENTKESMLEGTTKMLTAIIEQNHLSDADMVSIFFSTTKDLDAVYPAVAARRMGITNASLLCLQEMAVEGSLKMCIRCLMHVDSHLAQKEVKHIYLNKAQSLRPDLMLKELENA